MRRRADLAEAERAGIHEERELLRGRSLDDGLREALVMAALTVAELARRVGDDEAELMRILADQEPLLDLRERWEALHPSGNGA